MADFFSRPLPPPGCQVDRQVVACKCAHHQLLLGWLGYPILFSTLHLTPKKNFGSHKVFLNCQQNLYFDFGGQSQVSQNNNSLCCHFGQLLKRFCLEKSRGFSTVKSFSLALLDSWWANIAHTTQFGRYWREELDQEKKCNAAVAHSSCVSDFGLPRPNKWASWRVVHFFFFFRVTAAAEIFSEDKKTSVKLQSMRRWSKRENCQRRRENYTVQTSSVCSVQTKNEQQQQEEKREEGNCSNQFSIKSNRCRFEPFTQTLPANTGCCFLEQKSGRKWWWYINIKPRLIATNCFKDNVRLW